MTDSRVCLRCHRWGRRQPRCGFKPHAPTPRRPRTGSQAPALPAVWRPVPLSFLGRRALLTVQQSAVQQADVRPNVLCTENRSSCCGFGGCLQSPSLAAQPLGLGSGGHRGGCRYHEISLRASGRISHHGNFAPVSLLQKEKQGMRRKMRL